MKAIASDQRSIQDEDWATIETWHNRNVLRLFVINWASGTAHLPVSKNVKTSYWQRLVTNPGARYTYYCLSSGKFVLAKDPRNLRAAAS